MLKPVFLIIIFLQSLNTESCCTRFFVFSLFRTYNIEAESSRVLFTSVISLLNSISEVNFLLKFSLFHYAPPFHTASS